MKALQRTSAIAAIVLINCLAGGTVAAEEQYSQAKAEQYIKAAEDAWAESVATNDASVVTRILADDCVWLLDGEVFDKAHAVADAAKGPGDFLSNHLEYAHVRFFGNTAVVQGSEMWTQKGGKKGRFLWLDTWVRRNGQWQIVGAVDTTLPVKE